MIAIILGLALIILQIFSYIGNISSGTVFFTNFSIYEIISFVAFNLVGIIGLVFLIIGIRSKSNKEENDEEPYEYVSKPVRAPVIEDVSPEPKRIRSFLALHKKAFFLLTVVFIVTSVWSFIIYDDCAFEMIVANNHYEDTVTSPWGESYYIIGCGVRTCSYCKGYSFKSINRHLWSPYDFQYYCDISDKQTFCEVITVISALLSLLTLSAFVIGFVHEKNNKELQAQIEPSNSTGRKFCKYCGINIDKDSRFCSSCGKRIL